MSAGRGDDPVVPAQAGTHRSNGGSARGPKPRHWPRRVIRSLFALACIVLAGIVVIVASVLFLASTDTGLDYLVKRVERLTDGRLSISGASGSLLSRLAIRELRWRGPTATIVAQDVFVEWQPAALASRELRVDALGANRVDLAIAPSGAAAGASSDVLPRSIGLPLDVALSHVSITTLDWQLGERKGRVTGIAFGYHGNARAHRLDDVTLAFERGRVTGNATLGAAAPFPIGGAIGFAGEESLAGIEARAKLDGVLARIGVSAEGTAGTARFDGTLVATPFAAAPFDTLDVDARDVDLASINPAWPASALTLGVHAKPAAGGYAGTFALDNPRAGRLDQQRVPLESASGSFAQHGDTLSLTGLELAAAGGRASGSATVQLEGGATQATLDLAGIDLARIDRSLVATRIGGRLSLAGDARSQTASGRLADAARGLALELDARLAERRVTLSRARLTAPGGVLDGTASLALDGDRAFRVDATAGGFDPSRFADVPKGSIDGTLVVAGTLEPALAARVDARLAPSSRLAGAPLTGSLGAALSHGNARDVAVELALAGAKLTVHGDSGRPGDTLEVSLSAPKVAELVPLAPALLGGTRSGSLDVQASLAVTTQSIGGHGRLALAGFANARGERIGSLDIEADVAPGGLTASLADRRVDIAARARGLALGPREIDEATLAVQGSLAAHKVAVTVQGGGDHLDLAAHGTLASDGRAVTSWKGTLDEAAVGGTLVAKLEAPAALEWTPERAGARGLRIAFAGGSLAIDALDVDHGRVSTTGAFHALPLEALARVAGHPLTFGSTLTLSGRWDVAAAPRINGSIDIARESGDLYGADASSASFRQYPLGIERLTLAARMKDDAIALEVELASLRAGNAKLTASVAAGAEPAAWLDAPLEAHLVARLDTLAPYQPWIGTSAVVDGNATLDLTATGTPRKPVLAGSMKGDGLRVDAPQWGVAIRDGRLRATLAQDTLSLQELALHGGDGSFTASGVLARGNAPGDGTRIKWQARQFRALNRPDAQLVVSGDGTMTIADGRVALAGALKLDRGVITYSPTPAALGSDVVIEGRPPRTDSAGGEPLALLALDIDADLNRALSFSGAGLDARLGGRVRITTTPAGRLEGHGAIYTVHGTYFAFGQELAIDRGRLTFDGPLDNPALDIVALRRNAAVEAGVALTGTVRVPRLTITSNPPVPESEALSWLITGQAPGNATAGNAAALAAASAWMLGGDGRPVGNRLARNLGLDDISIRTESTASAAGGATANNQVISFGKRINDRLMLSYEQGLSIAQSALRLEYLLTRTLTLRAEAGVISGIGIFYRRSFR